MKLATYQDGSHDGQLVVVSQDLSQAHYAGTIAHHMRQLLDDWNFIAPQLENLYCDLNRGKAPYPFAFEPKRCMAPLPRPAEYLIANAFACELAPDIKPQVSNASVGAFQGAHSRISAPAKNGTLDFEAGFACVTETVEAASSSIRANESVRLLTLSTHLLVRRLPLMLPGTLPTYEALSAVCFSPVVVTCDETGEAWQDGKLNLRLDIFLNGQAIARCPTASQACFSIGDLLSQATEPHCLQTASMLHSGALLSADESKGYTSFLLKYLREHKVLPEHDSFPGLSAGDCLTIEMKGKNGQSLFGRTVMDIVPSAPHQ